MPDVLPSLSSQPDEHNLIFFCGLFRLGRAGAGPAARPRRGLVGAYGAAA